MTRRLLLAAGLALCLAGPAAAQTKVPPWDQPKVKAEARRVLKKIVDIVNASERNDGRLALYALRDTHWSVRLIAAVRLDAMGLDRNTCRALKLAAAPEAKPLAADAAPIAAAKAFVAKTPRAKLSEGPFSRITTTEALRVWTGFVVEQFLNGRDKVATRRTMLSHILAGRHVIPRSSRGWLARWLLSRLDQEAALIDLKAKTAKAAAGKDGQAVFAWYHDNLPYLYWHPTGRRFRLDVDARSAKTDTATYRKTRPWKADEGPNRVETQAHKRR